MAKNKLGDLNNHLFAALERLADEDLTPEQLQDEVRRAGRDSIADAAPRRYFQGTALETYDGVVKAVDLRGLFPEAKLVLSAGKKEISCIVAAKDVEMLRSALDNRALVTGRAQHDGRSMLPERIDVSKITLIKKDGNVLSLKGAMKGLNCDPMRQRMHRRMRPSARWRTP